MNESPLSSQAQLFESDSDRAHRLDAIRSQVRAIYDAAIQELGRNAANRIWSVRRRTRMPKQDRPAKGKLSSRDCFLLYLHDQLVSEMGSESLLSQLSTILHEQAPERFQNSQEIEARLRRLLGDRAAGKLSSKSGVRQLQLG